MHECSITETIINTAVEKAKENKVSKIKKINLVIGEMTGFMGDSIQFYFDRLSKGTITEGAVINIKFIKSKYKCTKCGNIFERQRFSFNCPECGGEIIPTKIGKECYIENIEV